MSAFVGARQAHDVVVLPQTLGQTFHLEGTTMSTANLMMASCPACQAAASLRHLHDAAHGMSETHTDGSERFECEACGHVLTRDEAEGMGLEYKFDVYP